MLRKLVGGGVGAGLAAGLYKLTVSDDELEIIGEIRPEALENWSGTHKVHVQGVYRPESVEQVEAIVKKIDRERSKIRCIGSGLSPNGIGLADEDGYGISVENMNAITKVDLGKKQVTVEAGALVGQVLDELKEHGLTLENLASINQQQMGGFTQVGAHGTGARIPPVDQQVVAMEIVSPGLGRIELSADSNPNWFRFAKCGLGAFGVVTKLTLQCVDAHRLKENTVVMTRREVRKNHIERLRENRHVRYMWIPYADAVVVVTSNPTDDELTDESKIPKPNTKPLTDLLAMLDESPQNTDNLSFADLRDRLLSTNTLITTHVQFVNKAESGFWKKNQTSGIVDDSFNVLAFECGGQQLVLESAFDCGTLDKPNGNDLTFMENLLGVIEVVGFPAPAPIEQRWSCGSISPMSPVACQDKEMKNKLFSWVGIIMYLPTKDPEKKNSIMEKFEEYKELLEMVDESGEYNIQTHWAKLEASQSEQELSKLQKKLAKRYPLEEFRKQKSIFDPNNCIGNEWLDRLLLFEELP